jgi:hypothetical protein
MDAIDRDALLGLPNLERAEKMSRLLERHNWEQKDLAAEMDLSIDKVSRYLMPIKLSKKTRDLIRLSPQDRRPPLGSIELLCRLTPPLQEEFVQTLPLNLSEAAQIKWLRATFASRGIILSREKYRRKYRLGEVDQFASRLKGLSRKAKAFSDKLKGMTPDGRKRALAIEEYSKRSKSVRENLRLLVQELQTLDLLLEPETPISQPEPVKQRVEVKTQLLVVRQPIAPSVVRQPEPKRVLPISESPPRQSSVQKGQEKNVSDITVEYWNNNSQRFALDKVSLRRYVELAQKGELKYQQLKCTRPEHLPDPAVIAQKLGIKL